MTTTGKLLFLPLAGAQTRCIRCGALCQVADRKSPDARMMWVASTPRGQCVNCAVSEWFFVSGLRDLVNDVKALGLPHVQAGFVAVMEPGMADTKPEAIDWGHVAAHWDDPFTMSDGAVIRPPPANAAAGRLSDPPIFTKPPRGRQSLGQRDSIDVRAPMESIDVVANLFPPMERAAFYERCEYRFFARDAPIPDVVRQLVAFKAKPQTPQVRELCRIMVFYVRQRVADALPIGTSST